MSLLEPALLESIARFMTPLLLAALGGALCERAGVFNISLEGMMLTGAFFAVTGSFFTGTWVGGLALSLVAGAISGCVFWWFSVRRGGDDIVVSIGLNILAVGLSVTLLRVVFDTRGQFDDPAIDAIPSIIIPVLSRLPYLGNVLSGQSLLFGFALFLAFAIQFLLYRHRFGLHLRAAGDNAAALQSVGVSATRVQLLALAGCGMLCALAGAQLSLSNVTLFAEGMSAGRGWIAVVIVLMCAGRPLYIMPAALFFGTVDAAGFRFQASGMPQQLTDSLPYVLAIVVLALSQLVKRKRSSFR